jgi:hypothetical protein
MPERAERFFWVYAKGIDQALLHEIDDSHRKFVAGWHDCPLDWTPCVKKRSPANQLWLFRLAQGIGKRGLARYFNKQLLAHIKSLQKKLKLTNKQIKRRSNLPTPLLFPPLQIWPQTDVGLHAVNDEYNGMLVTYSYYPGRYYQPPHMQISSLRKLVSTVVDVWGAIACDCHKGEGSECKGNGCYFCFQLNCAYCGGTGWKYYSRWVESGFEIEYETGYPIARI